MSIGKRIKMLRHSNGISIDELANKLGKNRTTVYRYENGEIENLPLDVLNPLAEALDTTPAYLMGWHSDNSKTKVVEYVRKGYVMNMEKWHNAFGINTFTEEECDKLIEYGKFLISQRKG